MQAGIDLRLRTMMKALSEVVMPAIDPANRLAVEQAQVILGSMSLLREQVDHAHWYEVTDLRSLCGLAKRLGKLDGNEPRPQLAESCANGEALAARWDVRLEQLRAASAELREEISLAVEAAYALPLGTAVQRLVLDHSQEQLGRERAYVAGTKWDGFPDTLQTIEASLRASPSAP